MKIIEQTETRLAFNIGIPHISWTHCDLDRSTGRARIKRVTLCWPRKTVDIPLGEISSVRLGVYTDKNLGEAATTQDYPQVILRSGECITMAVFIYSHSKKAVAAMDAFLQPRATPSA